MNEVNFVANDIVFIQDKTQWTLCVYCVDDKKQIYIKWWSWQDGKFIHMADKNIYEMSLIYINWCYPDWRRACKLKFYKNHDEIRPGSMSERIVIAGGYDSGDVQFWWIRQSAAAARKPDKCGT